MAVSVRSVEEIVAVVGSDVTSSLSSFSNSISRLLQERLGSSVSFIRSDTSISLHSGLRIVKFWSLVSLLSSSVDSGTSSATSVDSHVS